jgi:lipopolysaccharide assembly outer membrane protein LptD (OstA)
VEIQPARRFFFRLVFPWMLLIAGMALHGQETAGGAAEAAAGDVPGTGPQAAGEGTELGAAGELPGTEPGAGGEVPDTEPGAGGENAGEEAEAESPEAAILRMDIRTSTLSELANWCRSLGLSEGGDREALAERLRNHYELSPQAAAAAEEGEPEPKIITIESARSTEYFTLDVVDEEYARLRGDVVVSLKDGDAVHRIKAWEILYNRTRNILSASGGVEYVKEDGDTRETFRGESITVDLDNWSSIFMGGVSERSMQDNDTTYRFSGNLITRSDEEVTVITRARISNPKNEEAYWSLTASKLWLLPGSDWALVNGVLKVGEIPVLYLPVFFFPSDEIIFHPVLGYRSREGQFVQTTTYILGRPQAVSSSESSITKILGNSADMEKTREGVFLRSTGRKSRDPNDTRLSVLFDAYANLGFYLGTELALPAKGRFGATSLSAGVGFTRDIYLVPDSNYYTPFPRFDGTSDWNSSHLFSAELPLRYRLNTTGSLSGKYGSLSWGFPMYSDPFVNREFLNRSENQDLFAMVKELSSGKEEEVSTDTLGSYEWKLRGTITPSLPLLSPYLSSLSVSDISSSVSFRTRDALPSNPGYNPLSPERKFFFPDKITLYSITTSIAGTPLTLDSSRTTAASQTAGAAPEEAGEDPLGAFGVPVSPWETGSENAAAGGTGDPYRLSPPPLSQRFEPLRPGGQRFVIDYRFNPSSVMEMQLRSNAQNWPAVEDVDWSEVSSVLSTLKTDGSTGFTLSETNGLYTGSLRFSGTASWQDYTSLNTDSEDYNTQDKVDAARMRAYNSTFFTTSSEFTVTVKPLYRNAIWGNSSLRYTLKGLIAKSVLNGQTPEEASWDVEYGKWDKEHLDTHQAAATIEALVRDKAQTLVITSDLPPEDTALTGDATARVWLTTTNVRGKVFEPFDPEDRKVEPLYFTETLKFNNSFSLSQTVVYEPEPERFSSLTSSLSLYGLTASFTASYGRTYSLNISPPGWVQSTEESLNPREFKLAFVKSFKKEALWKKRLNFSVNLNTDLTFNLQQYTYSNFKFTLGFTLGITNFLDFSFSATTQNSVIFRYFQDLPFFDLPLELPGEKNLFVDLFNSFRFDDEELRKNSGFKLKSFNISLLHHLGDWNARLGLTLTPYLDQSSFPYRYKFNNEISFIVQWVPISEIKSEIVRNKDKFEFK